MKMLTFGANKRPITLHSLARPLATIPSRAFTLLLVLLLGLLGYWLAPEDLQPGSYTARVTATINGRILTIEFPFILGQEAGDPVTQTVDAGAYQLLLQGETAVPYQLGQNITYSLKVLDENGRPLTMALDDVTSTIHGPGYEQVLPATQRDGDWLRFTMRVPYKAGIALGLLAVVAALWLTELVPLAAAAMLIPIVVVVAGITDAATVLQPFAHPIIILFLAGFLMAEGMRRTGVDRRIALTILGHASLKPASLMLTMMSLSAFLSMWMSNTASVALLIPIALAILDKIPEENGQTGFRRALILGVAYAASIGGVGSAIGTPANILALTFLNEFTNTELAFVDWFAYGLPITVIMVPVIWLFLLISFRVRLGHVGAHLSHDVYEKELKQMGRPDSSQWVVLLVFATVVFLWLTERWHGVPTAVIALAGAFVLFITQTIHKEDLNRINWNALLTFGGGLAIGTILVTTGISDWIALQLVGLANQPPMLVIFLVAGLTLIIGAFISNTACAAMLIPLAIPLARILQIDPRLLVAVIAIGSSIDFALVVGTPPTMMAYSTGLFDTKEIFKRGIVLDALGVLILSFGVIWIWQWLGVVTLGN